MRELVMLVGLPASGKSAYAEQLKQEGYHVHSSDKIREELTGDVDFQDKNAEVFTELHRRIKSDLQNGVSCVYDATNMSMKRRMAFLNEIKQIDCNKVCILFAIPVEVCKERNQQRERKVPDDVFDRMLRNFWVPMHYEGWDLIGVIALNDYQFNYPYEKAEGFNQHNKHHTLSLSDHMLQTLRHIEENDMEDMPRFYRLCLAATGHDIGKLYTQSFVDDKGNITEEAHYYGHDCYGAYIFLLDQIYNSPTAIDEKLYMASLINWHMRPYLAWSKSEKSRERDRKLIGEEMYQDIMLLHEADVAAH